MCVCRVGVSAYVCIAMFDTHCAYEYLNKHTIFLFNELKTYTLIENEL